MRKTFKSGSSASLLVLCAVLIMALVATASAMKREVAENPLYYRGLGKVTQNEPVICEVGMVATLISNSTYEKATGIQDWTILLGDDSAEFPSMIWKTPALYAANNHYLYFASLRIGYRGHQIHFAEDRVTPITVKRLGIDPGAISLFDTEFSMDDQSGTTPVDYRIGARVTQRTYAWSESYRDDFIIYDYRITNLSDAALESVYVGLHNDADVSTAEGGQADQAWSIDDLPGYYRDDATKEYISFVRDADNPSVPGDDTGGRRQPKESSGYLGSRLIYCPARVGYGEDDTTTQMGHDYWDWNSDPSDDAGRADWIERLMTPGFLEPPPSPFDYRYYQHLGPFRIGAGDSIRVIFALGIGEGLSGLRENLEWADYLYEHNWVGASAPNPPIYTLEGGDGQVTITWDDGAESSTDPFSGEQDFEGYRVYKRTPTGWSLLMDADIVNDIGFNTGLVHSYVDYDVHNYFQYSYAVTSYDRGDPFNNIESLESGIGSGRTVEPGSYVMTKNSAKTGIHVLPNPFVAQSKPGFGFNPTQNNPSKERIVFVNLQPNSTIRIYTLTGDLITTIQNISSGGQWQTTASWDLITDDQQTIVTGLYLYQVESPGEEDFVGKFAVVR